MFMNINSRESLFQREDVAFQKKLQIELFVTDGMTPGVIISNIEAGIEISSYNLLPVALHLAKFDKLHCDGPCIFQN